MCATVALSLVGLLSLLAFDFMFAPNFEPPEDLLKMILFGVGFVGVSLYVGRWALAQARKPAPKFG